MAMMAASGPLRVSFAILLWLCLISGSSGVLKEAPPSVSTPSAPAVRASRGSEFCLSNQVGVGISWTDVHLGNPDDWEEEKSRPDVNFSNLKIPHGRQECRHMEFDLFALIQLRAIWVLYLHFDNVGAVGSLRINQVEAYTHADGTSSLDWFTGPYLSGLTGHQVIEGKTIRVELYRVSAASSANSTVPKAKRGNGGGSSDGALLPLPSP